MQGRRALITGGASGIGFATGRRFRKEGASVAILDVNAHAGRRAAEEIEATFIECDVTDSRNVKRAFEEAAQRLGGLDIAYLNAGITSSENEITLLDDAEYRRVVGVNVDGVFFGVREATRLMTNGGAIVATASIAGINAYPVDPLYSLTKHAVVGITRSLAPLLERAGITINCICPGIVDTPLLGEMAESLINAGFPLLSADDVAEAVMRAINDGGTGGAWVVQPGREPLRYEFRGVPGPRTPGAEGKLPPIFD